jgi:hypothetical protein
MHRLSRSGIIAWEWRREFPFRAAEWIKTDALLREEKMSGVLFVDECLPFLRHINDLCTRISRHEKPALRVIITANHAQWVPRIKAPELFKFGVAEKISELNDAEVAELITLLESKTEIRNLVPAKFNSLPRLTRIERLRRRCQADMFVCLKHIFSFQSLDQILLSEYAALDETQQDIYRLVAFVEAACGTVHRQMILRLIDISATSVKQRLDELEGLVDEFDIEPAKGLYGWRTRHSLVSRTLTQYKYADESEVCETLKRIIDGVNPIFWIEIKMLTEMCGSEWGINQIANPEMRIELFRRIIKMVPTERVSRHRLITALIETEQFDDALAEIEDAATTVRRDPPLQRYKVKLFIARAQHQNGLLREDRMALLRNAERLAQDGIERFPHDKRLYLAYADVGEAISRISGDKSVLNHALSEMSAAAQRLLDPDFAEQTTRYMRRQGY